jgi:hypothetical protein
MPESPLPLTPQNQIDWHGMLHDLEKSVEQMSDALDGVRMAVRRLVMAEAWLPQTTVEPPLAAAQPIPAGAFEPVADQIAGVAVPPPIAEQAHQHSEPVPPPAALANAASQIPVTAEDEEDAREAVGRAVEDARAELNPGPASASKAAPPVWSEEEEREAVRRAVEQARVEMAAGRVPNIEEASPPRPLPQRPVNPQHLLPTLTIEDPESRVELSRVYGLLQRLGVAAQASLLNYTSRQVSVMLGPDAARLTTDDFVRGVSQTMGRESRARQDGANVIVELAGAKEEAA